MADRLKINNGNREAIVIEMFGRDLQYGDAVIIDMDFPYVENKSPIAYIDEKGFYVYCEGAKLYEPNFRVNYVYKLSLTEEERHFLEHFEMHGDFRNSGFCANAIDFLLRPINKVELVLYNDGLNSIKAAYGLMIGENKLFNGSTIQDFYNPLYIVSSPTAEEIQIKNRLIASYKKLSNNIVSSKYTEGEIGKVYCKYNTIFISLGYIPSYRKNMAIRINTVYLLKGLALVEKLQTQGLTSEDIQNYLLDVGLDDGLCSILEDKSDYNYEGYYKIEPNSKQEIEKLIRQVRKQLIRTAKKLKNPLEKVKVDYFSFCDVCFENPEIVEAWKPYFEATVKALEAERDDLICEKNREYNKFCLCNKQSKEAEIKYKKEIRNIKSRYYKRKKALYKINGIVEATKDYIGINE